MAASITRYDKMPIPAIDAHTRYFESGRLRIGVEYRVLDDAVAAAARLHLEAATGVETGKLTEIDDRGVSLHVYVQGDGGWCEHLRFDCFEEEPHYHYVSWAARSNEVLHVDPFAVGDPLGWALECLRTRLPQMLRRAEPGREALVSAPDVDTIMPRVAAAAYAARFDIEPQSIEAAAHGPASAGHSG